MRRLLAVLCLAASACAAGEAEPPLVVVARLGDADLGVSPPVLPQSVRLGFEARPAVCFPRASFALAIDSGVRRILLGIGLAPAGDPTAAARFVIREETGDETEQILFEEELSAQAKSAQTWSSRSVWLPARPGDAPRRLRFAAEPMRGGRGRPCWGGVAFLAEAPAEAPARPNVILVSLDTLGASGLGWFGGAGGVSPALDDLLARSFSFRRAYTSYPRTYVSHSSLFTAQHPVRHGRYTWTRDPLPSLVREFQRAGYRTVAFTEDAYVGSVFGFANGFDRFDDGGFDDRFAAVSGNASRTFAKAADWLEAVGEGTRFFLFLHTYEVHSPYVPRDESAVELADGLTPDDTRRFEPGPMAQSLMRHNSGGRRLSSRDIRRYEALYAAEVHQLDRVVAGLLLRLSELGLAERTLLVVTADHGEQFGEWGKVGHAWSLHDRVLHVPLAFHWPGTVSPGEADQAVELIDVLPTLLDLAGLPAPAGLDGRSLAPLVRGDVAELPARPAFAELHRRQSCEGWNGPGDCVRDRYVVRTERYKYLASRSHGIERLYDLQEDPRETRDVAAERPRVVARHRALLAKYLAGSAASPGAAPALPPEGVGDDTLERLRALGYLE